MILGIDASNIRGGGEGKPGAFFMLSNNNIACVTGGTGMIGRRIAFRASPNLY